MPELYDLRFGSGVFRDEFGVTLLRGIKDGDCAADRTPADGGSGCSIGGVHGIGGGFGIIDKRFIRCASVGLIVRAPRPVANALGKMDMRLLDEGVLDPSPVDLAGERDELMDEDPV